MASIKRNGSKWRAQVYVRGVRDSESFQTRQEAAKWGLEREAELRGRKLPDKSYSDALTRYSREVAPTHGGEHWELLRINAWLKTPFSRRKLATMSASDFAEWRDGRLKQVKPGTVARELNLHRAVLEVARLEWKWIAVNPLDDVKWPKTPKGRRRRISPEEVTALAKAFGVHESLKSDTATQRIGLAFLLALETAMRSNEMLSLTWPNVYLDQRFVRLPKTKNGDEREVALSLRAVAILKALPKSFGTVFNLDAKIRDAVWRKVRNTTPHRDIHFHDSRAEAIWRLSKKLDILQLATMIGHRDLKSLMFYYDESASDMAKKLG